MFGFSKAQFSKAIYSLLGEIIVYFANKYNCECKDAKVMLIKNSKKENVKVYIYIKDVFKEELGEEEIKKIFNI